MKRILLTVVFLVAGILSFAQTNPTETVYLSNGSVIKCNVIEQTKESIKIMVSDGSIFVYEASQVEKIVKNDIVSLDDAVVSQNDKSSNRPFIKGVRFNGYFEMHILFSDPNRNRTYYGLCPSASMGVRIFDYGYVGVMTGTDLEFGDYNDYSILRLVVPFMIDTRGYFPINEKYHPYLEFACGGGAVFDESEYVGTKVKFRLCAGIDIRRLSLGLGWNATGTSNHQGFVKVGVKIGKTH